MWFKFVSLTCICISEIPKFKPFMALVDVITCDSCCLNAIFGEHLGETILQFTHCVQTHYGPKVLDMGLPLSDLVFNRVTSQLSTV